MSETCEGCRFFRCADGMTLGDCHRRPPYNHPYSPAKWPPVDKGDWCGEWQPVRTVAINTDEKMAAFQGEIAILKQLVADHADRTEHVLRQRDAAEREVKRLQAENIGLENQAKQQAFAAETEMSILKAHLDASRQQSDKYMRLCREANLIMETVSK